MSVSERIILTDLRSNSNKKISYSATDESEMIIIRSTNITSWNFWEYLRGIIKDVFLPRGYPDSVSSDYLEYQAWDTLQAFCSSISGTLAMSAVMKGIGVGSSAATPISAAITWLLKDGTGMVGSIWFAWFKGSSFDTESKQWRLIADVLNDIAMFVELFIPIVIDYSMYMLLLATSLKSLVGTAGSSTRMAFITHQAIKGNTADVSAKDGSQEIVTNLCAFVVGIFLLKNVTETQQIWFVMCISTLFHLLFNYKAVRCLKMNVFNSERLCICIRAYLPTSIIPTVEQVNNRESLSLIRSIKDVQICDFSIEFGSGLVKVFANMQVNAAQFVNISTLFENKTYFIIADTKGRKLYITFRERFRESDVLKAYFHAILIGISFTVLQGEKNLDVISRSRKNSPIYRLKNTLSAHSTLLSESSHVELENKLLNLAYTTCEDFVEKEFSAFCGACYERGWVLNKHLINIGDWRSEWPQKPESSHPYKGHMRTHRLRRKGYQKDMNLLLVR